MQIVCHLSLSLFSRLIETSFVVSKILSAKAKRLSKPVKRSSTRASSISNPSSLPTSPTWNQGEFESLSSSLILTPKESELELESVEQKEEHSTEPQPSQSQATDDAQITPVESSASSSSTTEAQLCTTSIPDLNSIESEEKQKSNPSSIHHGKSPSNVSLPSSSSSSRHSHHPSTSTSNSRTCTPIPPVTSSNPIDKPARMASPLPSRASVSPAPSHGTSNTFGTAPKFNNNNQQQPQRANSFNSQQLNPNGSTVAPPVQVIDGPAGRILCVADVRGE